MSLCRARQQQSGLHEQPGWFPSGPGPESMRTRERQNLANACSAGFQACCIADFQVGRNVEKSGASADWKPAIQQAWKPALTDQTVLGCLPTIGLFFADWLNGVKG